MIYPDVVQGTFLCRPNRFIAHVQIDNATEICHVKNTGRCRELLLPGATVYLQKAANPNRKTKYDLIAVNKGTTLINMDSSAPNKVFAEWARNGQWFGKPTLLKPEVTYGQSRLDFYLEANGKTIYIEVKGVTLEENGVAMFPDAPTPRGIKHLRELEQCVLQGNEAAIFFIVQMDNVHLFTPNYATHPEFGAALKEASAHGVGVYALDCCVTPGSITARQFVPVRL